uniref:Pco069460 n=1 Tax=Arundo donax TaxID=35708 RepID=A0A0A9FTU3_ARUDO
MRHSFSSWTCMQLLYLMMPHSYPKQQEVLLQYIWHVALTAPRPLFLYNLMFVLMLS